MKSYKKILVVSFMWLCVLVTFAGSSWGDKDSPGLLEQSKQLLTGTGGDETDWITEKTGQFVPLSSEFVDERGHKIRLGDIIDRPTILLPIYFYCPNICSKNLANLAIALTNLSFRPGKDFRVIALSFNEAENHEDAEHAKRNYLKIVGEGFPADEWRFLTGQEDAIKAVTEAVGFRFQKVDEVTFLHPAALMAIAADGKIIRYVYGSFLAGDIDMALADAKSGVPSMSVKRLLGFCFNYDPNTNKSVFQAVKIGVFVLLALILVCVFFYYRQKDRRSGIVIDNATSTKQEENP